MESGSVIRATGGEVRMTAVADPSATRSTANGVLARDPESRIRLESGRLIDVSGSTATASVSRNAVEVELRANELKDSPLQRDGALLGETALEVPSPTFALQQTYATPRLTVSHFDFYRLASADEARGLGFEEALQTGAVVVEWPERALSLLPEDRIEIVLAETADPDRRLATVRGLGSASARVRRIGELMAFLDAQPGWAGATASGPIRATWIWPSGSSTSVKKTSHEIWP